MGCAFLDVEGDGDLDLYVVSGGVECDPDDELLRDRLCLNDGEGDFHIAPPDALEDFAQAWDAKYPTIAKVWRSRWTDIITLFDFPPPIRKAIYTTNAIESVNSVIRKFAKNRKIYPNEGSAKNRCQRSR